MLAQQHLVQSQLLRGCAGVLELSAVTTTTAFTFLRRVQLSQHTHNLSSQVGPCMCRCSCPGWLSRALLLHCPTSICPACVFLSLLLLFMLSLMP
jgi:hypothetical protein